MGSNLKTLKWKYKGANRIWFYLTATSSDAHMTSEDGAILTQWEVKLEDERGEVYHTFPWYDDEPLLIDCLQSLSNELFSILLGFAKYGEPTTRWRNAADD